MPQRLEVYQAAGPGQRDPRNLNEIVTSELVAFDRRLMTPYLLLLSLAQFFVKGCCDVAR